MNGYGIHPQLNNQLVLGSVVSFRYNNMFANDRTPMVFLLTPNFEGKLHGLNIRYMRQINVRQLYWFFQTPQQRAGMIDPFEMEEEIREKSLQNRMEAYQEQKQKALLQQTGVIVRPQRGSVFGVSTWKRGPLSSFPAITKTMRAFGVDLEKPNPTTPGLDRLANVKPPEITTQQRHELQTKYYQQISDEQSRFINNPYLFYHSFVKPLLGNSREVSKCYRTYDPFFIQNLRIVHSVPRLTSI